MKLLARKSSHADGVGLLSISNLMRICGAVILAALVGVASYSWWTTNQIRIDGDLFNNIVDGKDFIADFLPPPMYPVEAFALASIVAADPNQAETSIPKIRALRAAFDQRLAFWDKKFASSRALSHDAWIRIGGKFHELGDAFWAEMDASFLPAVANRDSAAMQTAIRKLTPRYQVFASFADATASEVTVIVNSLTGEGASRSDVAHRVSVATNGAVILMIAFLLFAAQRFVVQAITTISSAMRQLAEGNLETNIPFSERRDEVGQLAKAMAVFKANAKEKTVLQKKAEEEAELRRLEEKRQAELDRQNVENQARVVQSISIGLSKLADRDLSYRIVDQLPDAYDKLKKDFNAAVGQLEDVIRTVTITTDSIKLGTSEISSASDDLARRTENQATNLEETAATIADITSKVKKAADGAALARKVVTSAKEEAAKSGEVVKGAIESISRIERSSQQITRIIGVIDEIAFQTNLLALNAGVEAARAGDAGNGFAVVAQEVRALAQRSADAAKEIKTIIAASRTEVEQGVQFVGQTGDSLDRIVARVMEINQVVNEIALAAQDQSSSLTHANSSVNLIDQATQQNAAMVEQATAATKQLALQADELNQMIASFVITAQSLQEGTKGEYNQASYKRVA